MTATEARHLRITGRVQGVGFRHYMTREAQRIGLDGWVRNRADGSVEAVICGNAEAIATMIHWSRSGPPAARVDQVLVEDIETIEALPDLAGFMQLETE